jgi:Protein of unknown function (DUF3313)
MNMHTLASSRSRRIAGTALAALLTVGAVSMPAHAKDELPAVSPEGLKLMSDTKASVVYLREGADFSGYDKVAILDCYVAFRKDWKRDQDRLNPTKVSDNDVIRIKAELAKEFKKVFGKRLTKKGETVVTAPGTGVLILRPAIVNLDIAAPDTAKAGRSYAITADSGQATLFLELYDGVSNELLARAIDVRVADYSNSPSVRSAVTNRAEAEDILTTWADLLGTFLQNSRASSKPDPAK